MLFINKLIWTLFHLTPDTLRHFIENDVGVTNFRIILFLIIFAETGLVVTPILPGDSLLFAIGVVCRHTALNMPLTVGLVLAAVLLGDNTNYWIGRRLGPAVFRKEQSRLLNKKHLARAQAFYETYGAKTIVLARFVPIVRTFAPFVAGIGRMAYPRFLTFSILGGVLWVAVCMTAGYTLAGVKIIRDHFDLVAVAIVAISVMPMVIEYLRHRAQIKRAISPKVDPSPADPTITRI
jgi:membrane-associated protein